MLKLYDKKSSLTMPNGRTRTASDMKESGEYDLLFVRDCVIDVSDAGVFQSYQALDDVKRAYGVTEPDPEKALALVIEAQKAAEEAAKQEAVTMESLKAQLADQQAALLELGDLIGGE